VPADTTLIAISDGPGNRQDRCERRAFRYQRSVNLVADYPCPVLVGKLDDRFEFVAIVHPGRRGCAGCTTGRRPAEVGTPGLVVAQGRFDDPEADLTHPVEERRIERVG
jgi:hypothetical protein